MQQLSLRRIAEQLDCELLGDPDLDLTGVASLENAGASELSFVVSAKHLNAALASNAGALIVSPPLADKLDCPRLVANNPHSTFARAIALFHPRPALQSGIHPSAVTADSAKIDPTAEIGPNVVIGRGASIGPRTRIGANSTVAENAILGADCELIANVTIYADCRIGDRVLLHAGCVIGSDGFGNAWESDHWVKIPQIGRVLIGDDVEIGANTTIDRGALDDTVIANGARIDNLVQIAHNCQIGENTAIAGCAGLAGSTKIGRNCLIGGAAMILGHIEIGDGVTVSGASFIGKSIKGPGVFTSTQPQMPHDEWLKNAAQLRHLSDMRNRIRALEKQLNELQKDKS